MTPRVQALDHLVLTGSDIGDTLAFYRDVLGMEPARFTPADGPDRWVLRFGGQKTNLHQRGAEFEPRAAPGTRRPEPGRPGLSCRSTCVIPMGT